MGANDAGFGNGARFFAGDTPRLQSLPTGSFMYIRGSS